MLRRLANGAIDATAVTRSASARIGGGEDREPGSGRGADERDARTRRARDTDEGVDRRGRHLAHAHARELRRDRDEAGARKRARGSVRPRAGRCRVASPRWRTRRPARSASGARRARRLRRSARARTRYVAAERRGEDGERADHAAASSSIVERSQRYQSLWKSSPGSCSSFASRNAGSCGYAVRSCRRVAQRW